MQVVLLTDIKKVGQRGSVVTVADGYAMNVLIPKKQALPATPENLKRVEKEAQAKAGKREMDAAMAKVALGQIDGKTVVLKVNANSAGGLFKGIHEGEIADAVEAALGISIPKQAIQFKETIKKTGSYEVPVSLHGASAKITLQLRGA